MKLDFASPFDLLLSNISRSFLDHFAGLRIELLKLFLMVRCGSVTGLDMRSSKVNVLLATNSYTP